MHQKNRKLKNKTKPKKNPHTNNKKTHTQILTTGQVQFSWELGEFVSGWVLGPRAYVLD